MIVSLPHFQSLQKWSEGGFQWAVRRAQTHQRLSSRWILGSTMEWKVSGYKSENHFPWPVPFVKTYLSSQNRLWQQNPVSVSTTFSRDSSMLPPQCCWIYFISKFNILNVRDLFSACLIDYSAVFLSAWPVHEKQSFCLLAIQLYFAFPGHLCHQSGMKSMKYRGRLTPRGWGRHADQPRASHWRTWSLLSSL